MKKNISFFAILLLMGTASNGFASLCTTGEHVGNPHCQGHSSTSGTASGNTQTGIGSHGQTPDPATQNPQTGSVTPDYHNTQLIPDSHKPKLVKTPAATPKQVTPQVPEPIPQKTPELVTTPPKPDLAPTATPPKVPQAIPQKKPQLVPSITITGTYQPGPSGNSPVPTVTGSYQPGPSGNSPVPTATGTYQPGPSGYSPVPTATGIYQPGPSGYSPVPTATGTYQRGPAGYSPVPTVTGTYLPGPSGYSPVPVPKPAMTPAAIPPQVPPVTQKTPQLIPPKTVAGTSQTGPSGQLPVPTASRTNAAGSSGQPLVQGGPSTGRPADAGQSGTLVQPQMLPQSQPTHHFIIANDHLDLPVTSGPHPAGVAYNLEIIEPGIQNKQVAVYRSNDAREVLYKDAIKMDSTGFFLIDLGIRDPEYIK